MVGQNLGPHTMLSCFHGNGYPSAAQGYNQMCQAPAYKPQQQFGNMLFSNQMPSIYHTQQQHAYEAPKFGQLILLDGNAGHNLSLGQTMNIQLNMNLASDHLRPK